MNVPLMDTISAMWNVWKVGAEDGERIIGMSIEEEIIKRLKEKREYHLKERARNHWEDKYMCLKHLYEADSFAEAIEIVKEVAEEYYLEGE
jgi:hypothetical protein